MPLPLFVAHLFSIPVPHSVLFGDGGESRPVSSDGQYLLGDPRMPPTAVSTWPAWANALRNACLALFLWSTYSVLDLGYWPGPGSWVYVAFGEDGKVIPRRISTRFIMVKHGFEMCRFIIYSQKGVQIPFTVRGRGTKKEVIERVYQHLIDGEGGLQRLNTYFLRNEVPPEVFFTFV